ncbi:MAG: hydroxyisourate hydrolase [Proteobacteria bacterium]|nr:hydroxyisourate hydrolase [Pseudomonadota bacterium]
MGKLTTHVLDTANGKPASGMAISLYRCKDDSKQLVGSWMTNADGRCDAPILDGVNFHVGTYELVFAVASYFDRIGDSQVNPSFLDLVPVRFSIADADAHYHVPLLVSPWSYSTYRGS